MDGRLTAIRRSFRKFSSMDATHEGMLHGGLSPGGSPTLSRLDDVSADVRLRARLADLADENVYATEGDPVPILD